MALAKIGLPKIQIIFERLSSLTRIQSERDILVAVLEDATAGSITYTFNRKSEVKASDLSEDNKKLLDLAFKGNPKKIIVEIMSESRNIDAILKGLTRVKFQWLSVVTNDTEKLTTVKQFIVEKRQAGKPYKAVLPNVKADEKGIVNFTTTGLEIDGVSIGTHEYCLRLAGLFAGLNLTMSATHYLLDELTAFTPHEDEETAINNGELILIDEGDGIKIGRAVTSLTTIGEDDIEDHKKIKIVETMDLITEDISTTFKNDYLGKVPNTYNNKMLFFGSINYYLKNLAKQEILDIDADNFIDIDVEAHEDLIIQDGKDITTFTEAQIRRYNTKSVIYSLGYITITDAVEDLKLKLFM